MKITVKKPSFNKVQLPKSPNPKSILSLFRFFYDYKDFSSKYFSISYLRLGLVILILSTITFCTYFLTSYIRNTELSNTEIAKQVAFINYTLWFAYLLFVLGINLLIVVFAKLLKTKMLIIDFLINQTFVAVIIFFLMRIVATVLIILDEKLPFEVELNYNFFNFNLLTILFLTQITAILIVYNYLLINLPEKIKTNKLLVMVISAIYLASVWTLTAP